MADELPALTGSQLIRLLTLDGWEEQRRSRHGVALGKAIGGRRRVAVVPTKTGSMHPNTLARLLGPKQTGVGRAGLVRLIERHGLR
ncbi:MAG TPA: hypothetical protein VFC51_01620 [Chloroflexota bacterium]|nr:hypothetical protein [Chloroflexota bacterium]